ncbi:hypothetical protein SAMN04488056_10283 [Cohaesibacter marisflavi]|uniref:Transcriptional regulator, AlpA family n=1 Tax=Cohaesibacter marisflavi TaxID=655353 RepID=A0A1I5C1L7_9HYPH|nr:hypothetical protein [Cohaesibacter marisflavi]SFN80855.1 hypothetical protein SAMN04488056_10283 [Cohaesibacter marisflavi]
MTILPMNIPKRGLNEKEAAEYCGLSASAFTRLVGKFVIPGPIPETRRWDRCALDAALDRLSGLTTNTTTSNALDQGMARDG